MLDLNGKVAAVTGAGSGIGRGISLALARAGADIAAVDIVEERAEKTAAEVRELGRKAIARGADVRDKGALEEMAEACLRELGGLHIAVANAGIGRGGNVLTMTEDDWDIQTDINQKGVFLTVQACARAMVKQNQGGRIITIASLAAERAGPGMAGYCGGKAAVRMMSRCWAQDLAPFGITVNSIGPGLIDTPLAAGLVGEGDQRATNERVIPANRIGLPDDIGRLACWLASDEADYVTGTYNLIDGGLNDASSFGLESPWQQAVQQIREARRSANGSQILGMMDMLANQMRTEGEQQRVARGLQ
jgi:3-oxoacyl-[acyl-carrier protein] reductase